MGYCDYTDDWLKDLTRQRRREAREARIAALPPTLRYRITTVEDAAEAIVVAVERVARRVKAKQRWKAVQWADGVRNCGYCKVRMTRQTNVPRTCTVDHREPLAHGGEDAASNWILACLDCNGRKGVMSELAFRRKLGVY